MKQNPNFILNTIADVPYLLPVGQAIADHQRGLKTNATGVYLWQLLSKEHSLDEVVSKSASHYRVSAEELPQFQEEITQFLQQLLKYGILTEQNIKTDTSAVINQIYSSRISGLQMDYDYAKNTDTYHLSIGRIHIRLTCPVGAFPPDFTDFITVNSSEDTAKAFLDITLYPTLPSEIPSGNVLLHNHELNIVEQEQQFLLHFPTAKQHLEIHLDKSGTVARCYSLPPYHEAFHYDFFHAVRLVFLYLAKKHDMVALHSASLLYKDKLWLFSGHSGCGKSTHTNLWKEYYHTPVINGDLNLLAIEDDVPVVHGIPWCGTSGIYSTKTYPLGGIILLKQSKKNAIEELTPDTKRLLIAQRLVSPAWDKSMWNKTMTLIDSLADDLFVCRLHCTKEKEAAEFMKNILEQQ